MTKTQPPPSILALIPAYNEGHRVAEVIRLTKQHLPVLVVDDGSSDDTAQHAEQAGAEVLYQKPNQGKGAALIAGFRRALKEGYRAVIMLDADLQHDPDEIPKFIEAFQEHHADLIIGQRDFRYMPRLRRTTNTFGTWVFSWAIGRHIPDNQSGFRLLSRRMMEVTLHSRETNFEFEVEMIVLCLKNRYKLEWVPIRTIYGDEKSHIRPFRHAYHFVRMIWQTRRTMRKLKHPKP
jgi:glycosyltransferase involved in cell wall biosynthesis